MANTKVKEAWLRSCCIWHIPARLLQAIIKAKLSISVEVPLSRQIEALGITAILSFKICDVPINILKKIHKSISQNLGSFYASHKFPCFLSQISSALEFNNDYQIFSTETASNVRIIWQDGSNIYVALTWALSSILRSSLLI